MNIKAYIDVTPENKSIWTAENCVFKIKAKKIYSIIDKKIFILSMSKIKKK